MVASVVNGKSLSSYLPAGLRESWSLSPVAISQPEGGFLLEICTDVDSSRAQHTAFVDIDWHKNKLVDAVAQLWRQRQESNRCTWVVGILCLPAELVNSLSELYLYTEDAYPTMMRLFNNFAHSLVATWAAW